MSNVEGIASSTTEVILSELGAKATAAEIKESVSKAVDEVSA